MLEERNAVSKYKSTFLPKYLVPEDQARNSEAERWAAAEAREAAPASPPEVRESLQPMKEGIVPPQYVDGMNQEFRDRCQAALDFAAARSANMGLPFDEPSKIALTALGTGKPASLNITEAGMKMASDFVKDYDGLVEEKKAVPGGTVGKVNFGTGAYGPDLGETIKLRHPLGALLGNATVMLDKDNKLVGIADQFDYDPANHKGVVAMGMRIVNDRITKDCPDRVGYVPITGGRPIPGYPGGKK